VSYCTLQDFIDRPFGEQELIQLTDRDNLGVINEAVLTQAISDAEAEINGYLTAYPLPLANVPANMVRIACDITRYYLYEGRMIDDVKERYNNDIKYLRLVAEGKISLGPDVNGTVASTSSDGAAFTTHESVFSRDTLKAY
jgi:phage gp36-like protein